MSDVTTSLEQAFDRIEDFRAIHEPSGVTIEAVLCLQEAVGIDEATRVLIRDRLYEGRVERRLSDLPRPDHRPAGGAARPGAQLAIETRS